MKKALVQTKAVTTLIETIRREIVEGKKNVENSIETEKTKVYWNIGKHIHNHLLENSDKAEYGEYLFNILQEELDIHKRTLYRAVQFYETYPKVLKTIPQLKWNHFLTLLTVKDEKKRKEYEKRVIEEGLSVRELREIIDKDKKDDDSDTIKQLAEIRGNLNIYKLNKRNKNQKILSIDMGFKFYINKLEINNGMYTENSIVQIKKQKNSYKIVLLDTFPLDKIYTYKGTVRQIIDGDTLWVDLDLGLDTWARKKVRFRGINSAKLGTETGIKAKRFIERKLKPCEFIIVKTYYRDKYNRFLADIFYDKNEKDPETVAEKGTFLNQQLLDAGYAVIYH